MPKLVCGRDLTQAQRVEVLRAFSYRWTHENKPGAWGNATWPAAPQESLRVSDAQWLSDHAFWITKRGRLAKTPSCAEPVYMAARR